VFGADLPAAVWRATMSGALAGVPAENFTGAGASVAVDVVGAAPGGSKHKKAAPPPTPPAAHQRPPKKHGPH
jgi:hypothetical protein